MEDELVHPYCGGCGHHFFGDKKILPLEAKEKAKTKRCHYCLQDEREALQKQPSPRSVVWFDEFGD